MQTKAAAGAHRLERLVRIVPSLALLVLLVLAALLLAARSAHATTQAPPSTVPLALEEEAEEELEAEAAEDEVCEEVEEEFEEGEAGETEVEEMCEGTAGEGEAGRAASGSTAPARCPLRSAHARAVVLARGRRLKLTVGYTTREPTGATIEINRGATRIGSFRRHLGRSGVLRIVKRFDGRSAPRRLVIQLRIAGSPRECGGKLTRRVRIRQRSR